MKYRIPHTFTALLLAYFALAAYDATAAGIEPLVPMVGRGELDSLVEVEKIQITAVKQGLSLRKEALSASILNSEDIARQGINAIKDVAIIAPNFFIPDYGSRTTSSIYVRGLGTRIEQPVVGLTIDNVPIADKNLYDMDLMDIERIEVLRGPQSTLYGRNTMCGVINIYTTSPLEYQGLRIRAEYGYRNLARIGVSTYNKFSNGVGLSIGGQYGHCDGFFRNTYNNSLCDNEDNAAMRTKFQFSRNRLKIDNTLALSTVNQGGYPYAPVKSGVIAYNDECSYRRLGITEGLSIKYDWQNVTLTNIASYQFLDDRLRLDQDFSPLSYFTLEQTKKQHDITEEIILRSRGKRLYKWLVGAVGLFKSSRMSAPVTFKQDGIDNLILKNLNEYSGFPGEFHWGRKDGTEGDTLLLESDFTTNTAGVAIYHESRIDLDRWHFKLGLRFDYEYARMRYINNTDCYYSAFPTVGEPIERHLRINNDDFLRLDTYEILPNLSVSCDLGRNKQNMLYLSVSKGYKAGGFNTQMFSEVLQSQLMDKMGKTSDINVEDVVTYRPEKSWNLELGGHFIWPDVRLSADFALFYIWCFDQQLTVFPEGQTTGRMMTNAGRTESRGIEASFSYKPHRNVTLSAAYGFTDARFTLFRNGDADYRGKRIPYSPSHTLSARVTYSINIGTRFLENIVLGVGYCGAGDIYWDEANSHSQPFYSLLDASLRFEHKRWNVELWGRNLACQRYNVFYFESMGNSFLQRGRPISFGVKFGVNLLEFN